MGRKKKSTALPDKVDANDETLIKIQCKFEAPEEAKANYKEEIKMRKAFIVELEAFGFKLVPGLGGGSGYGTTIFGQLPKNKLKLVEKIPNLTTSMWD